MNGFARASSQRQPCIGVAAHEGGGGCVIDVQALEQCVGRVVAAGAVCAKQLKAVVSQRVQLGLQRQSLDGFQYLGDRQV